MKNILLLVTILTLLSCNSDTTGTTNISILEDTTEHDFQVRPDADAILDAYHLKEDKWQSARFRYKLITDVSHNPQTEVYLKSAQSFMDNELERDVEVASFTKEVTGIIQDSIAKGRDHSSIFKPLVQEILSLQQDSSSVSTIYLFSDLQENDPNFFSIYHPNHQKLLQQQSEKVVELFLEVASEIHANTGMLNVVVIYQPVSVAEDRQFIQMKSLYQNIFDRLGIPIAFQSNM